MDETEGGDAEDAVTGKVIERLRRIGELKGLLNGSPAPGPAPGALLDELRQLVAEAEEWTRLEGDERARSAVAELGDAVAEIEEVRPYALKVDRA